MNPFIRATVVNGILRPDVPLTLANGTRVTLQLQTADNAGKSSENAFQAFLKYREKHPVELGEMKFNREELYD